MAVFSFRLAVGSLAGRLNVESTAPFEFTQGAERFVDPRQKIETNDFLEKTLQRISHNGSNKFLGADHPYLSWLICGKGTE